MKLFLVRHAPTMGAGRYFGRTDVPLSERGKKEAEMLADRMAREGLDGVFSSDLRRARETALPVASRHGLEPVLCPELRELDFGKYEGLTYEEIVARDPAAPALWRDGSYRFPGGDCLTELSQRVKAFFPRLEGCPPQAAMLLVAHGGSLRLLLCHLLGLGPEHWWQFCLDPASLTMVERHDQGAILCCLNDTTHLKEV